MCPREGESGKERQQRLAGARAWAWRSISLPTSKLFKNYLCVNYCSFCALVPGARDQIEFLTNTLAIYGQEEGGGKKSMLLALNSWMTRKASTNYGQASVYSTWDNYVELCRRN